MVTISALLAQPAAADQPIPNTPPAVASGNLGSTGASGQIAVPTAQPSTPAPSGGNGSGPCPAGQVATYQTETSGGQPLVAQPGDVNPQNGQPVQSGSTLVDIYCDGVAVSTIVVPPGGAAPPPPPAPAEVAALTPFPAETIHHTPCYMGLTGLRGDMWATVGAGPVLPIATTATIRGYTVHVTAQPVSYQWTTGNGASVVGTNSGSRDNPSASYTYDQTGNYTVTLTVAWSGTYTFSGHGISQTSALGPVNQSPPRQLLWPVQGVVSALVAPGYVDSTTLPTMASAC